MILSAFQHRSLELPAAAAMWETWRRSPVQPTDCTPTYKYDSINVNSITLTSDDGKPYSFSYTQDHSKWGVMLTSSPSKQYFCVGDINRMTSQFERGGGTVCAKFAPLFSALNASISGYDGCKSTSYASLRGGGASVME